MIPTPAKRLTALGICCAMFGVASAANLTAPLTETQIVATSGAAAPTQQTFTITTAEDLVVTLTDLQIPAELTSAGVVVTQNGAVVASAQLTAPATIATANVTGASGDYTIYIFGVPGSKYSVGTFTACVAPKTDTSNCITSASLSGLISAQSSTSSATVSTLSNTLTVTTAGSYTLTFSDLLFPTALAVQPTLALFQGSTVVQTGIASGTALTLSPGTYTLLSIAQADATAEAGLYAISFADAGGDSLLDTAVPVGALQNPASTVTNPSAQTLTLSVSDYTFPTALASASALLTSGSTQLGTASSVGGAQTFAAPATTLSLWTYGSAGGGAGTYSADVAGSTDLDTVAYGVVPSGSATYAFAYVTSIATAGAYQATAADLQFPSALSALSFEVAQSGVLIGQSPTAATVSITAAAGNAVVLVSAGAPTSTTAPNGLFDVNIQSSGSSATLAFDKTQAVSSSATLFNSQTVTVSDSASYQVTLTDLQFPTAFDSLALVVSRGSQVLGKEFGGGTLSFAATPGDYQLTFVASPSSSQLFGLYAASMVYAAPSLTLTASASSVASGSNVTLTWTAANATSCSASGGNWSGSVAATGGTASVLVDETATYTLSCTGAGGTASQTTTVTATTTTTGSTSKGGGGALDPAWLAFGAGLVLLRVRNTAATRRRKMAAR